MKKVAASNKRNSPSSYSSLASGLGSGLGLGSNSDSDSDSAAYRHQRKSSKASESLSKSIRRFNAGDSKQNTNARRNVQNQLITKKQIEVLDRIKQENKRWQQIKSKETTQIADGQGNFVHLEHRKQNHCEIEKRRRDKMNYYIMQLASIIPTSANNQSKFDKLTVLRMAVQHVKSLRSSLCSFSSFHLRPSFLSSGNLLKDLILQMAGQEAQDNLFMVVSCDRGKVLFVSRSSKDILNQDQNELVGQCLFDLLHKDDVSKVKEQISYFSLMPKEMLVDSKTLQPIKHNQRQSFSQLQNQSNSTPQPGARRSFFCRMRSSGNNANQASDTILRDSLKKSAAPSNNRADNELPNDCQILDRKNNGFKLNNDCNNTQLRTNTSQIGLSVIASDNLSSQKVDNNSDLNQLLPTVEFAPRNCSSPATKNDATIVDTANKKHISDRKISDVETINKETTLNKPNIKGDSSSIVSSDSSKPEAESSPEVSKAQSASSSITGTNQANDRLSSVDSSSLSKSDSKSRSSVNLRMSSSNSTSKKHWKYTVMHCTGYLKSITLNNDEIDDDDYDDFNSENSDDDDEENSSSRTINCLVAVCRRSPINRDLKPDRPLTFTCRYSMEGKFVFVDQRATVALGYTPQQLLGTSHYAYCHKDSINTFKECHRQCILKSESVSSDIYQFKRANGQHLWLQTSLKSFRNPWTKFIDYIVANHTTAEGNDPRYNEGCIPTKFNQDMTGEASQSSSPASTSLSLPSMDSKKSSSPGSSSIGSSYSMESCASGASVQALLNQIDRIKSGRIKHTLDFTKSRNDCSLIRSGRNSARKSNEDSGNYSDLQSCSSLSSSSALSNEYVNLQDVNNLPGNTNTNQAQPVNTNNFAPNATCYYNNKNTGYKLAQNLNSSMNYRILDQQQQQQQQQMTNAGMGTDQIANFERSLNSNQMSSGNVKIISRATDKPTRQSNGSTKQHNRIYNTHYHYKTPAKSCSSTSSDTGNESGTWSNSSGPVYSENSVRQGREVVDGGHQNQVDSIGKGHHYHHQQQHHHQQQQPQQQSDLCAQLVPDRSCKVDRQPSYIIKPVDPQTINIAAVHVPMDTEIEATIVNRVGDNYPSDFIPDPPYISQNAIPRYTNETQHMNNDLSQNLTMKLQHQAAQNIPVMWSQTGIPYRNNPNPLHNNGGGQICTTTTGDVNLTNMYVGNSNSQMVNVAQSAPCCQQFINHKCCCNQQSTDLNSINLTNLLVDGYFDEEQLVDYLAGYDPDAQLHSMHTNAFSNFNI